MEVLSAAMESKCQDYLQDWTTKYRLSINQIARELVDNSIYVAKAEQKMIESQTWQIFINNFRRSLTLEPLEFINDRVEFLKVAEILDEALQQRRAQAITLNSDAFPFSKDSMDRIFSFALKRAEIDLHDTIHTQRVLQNTTDLRVPHEWYPFTRITKRKIIFHGGPTNSGMLYI